MFNPLGKPRNGLAVFDRVHDLGLPNQPVATVLGFTPDNCEAIVIYDDPSYMKDAVNIFDLAKTERAVA